MGIGKIARIGQVEPGDDLFRFTGRNDPPDLIGLPEVVFALDALAVGVFGGIEGATRIAHVPDDIFENFLGRRTKLRIAGRLVRLDVGGGHERLVVKHLFEMRQPPRRIRAVAVETKANLVIHPALPHVAQGLPGHLERHRLTGALPVAEEENDLVGRREFWRGTETARRTIEAGPELRVRLTVDAGVKGIVASGMLHLLTDGRGDFRRVAHQLVAPLLPQAAEPGNQFE